MARLKIVCCSAAKDRELIEGFRAHMRVLEVRRVNIWYTQYMTSGVEREQEYKSQLQSAHLILLLISSDFLNSYEYKRTIASVIEQHKKGETRIVPIILRPVHWQDDTLLGRLQPLPESGKPVTDPDWQTLDFAFFNIVSGIKRIIDNNEIIVAPAQLDSDEAALESEDLPHTHTEAMTQLESIIQDFKSLRKHIADAATLRNIQGFSIENSESRYNKLYGDTMVFLARYLPGSVADEKGFIEAVYRRAAAELQRRNNFSVQITRWMIAPLAEIEKLAAQIDACAAILETYKPEISTL